MTIRTIGNSFASAATHAAIGIALATAPNSAQARDVSVSVNAATGVLTVGGWSRRVADSGTIFYTCEEDACGKGSTVSMRKQTAPAPDAETLRRNEMRVADTLRERAGGRIAKIEVGEPRVTNDGAYALGEIPRSITLPAGGGGGIHLQWRSGFIVSQTLNYTLVSSADSRQLCDDNYNTFKFGLMLMGARR